MIENEENPQTSVDVVNLETDDITDDVKTVELEEEIVVEDPIPTSRSHDEVETLRPTPPSERTWSKWNIATLWVGMSVNIPSYLLGASLIGGGLSWWEAILTILLGNFIVLAPLILNGHSGTKYGIPFPVFVRSMFGIQGSKVAAMIRALIGCGWFGIQTWIGGEAIYEIFLALWEGFKDAPYMESIKKLEYFSSPLLFVMALSLFIWACVKGGGLGNVLAASYSLEVSKKGFAKVFFPSLTGIVGFWATLSLNIMDFTRFTRSQRDQILGQVYGLPTTTTLFAGLGIFVTSATVLVYGEAIWNPVQLIARWKNIPVTVIAMSFIAMATLTTNVAANIVSPANDFSNLYPQKITFRMGGFITGILGIVIFPWKLINDPNSYIYKWLIASSSLLGAVTGVMICDYFLIQKTILHVEELYNPRGIYYYYYGFNLKAIIATVVAILPNVPGFIAVVYAGNSAPDWLVGFYDYAWFVSLGLSFLVYWLLSKFWKNAPVFHRNERENEDAVPLEEIEPDENKI